MRPRDRYLEQLTAYQGKSMIKIITGVRRCGKSSLLDLFEQHLLAEGVSRAAIIKMNFESLDYFEISNFQKLNDSVLALLHANEMNYILLDEVQEVKEWERAVNSLRLLPNTDIYITGSNAQLLASELSTLLSGRYIEVRMQPLSFKEFLDFNDLSSRGDLQEPFNLYLRYGGFPGISELMDYPERIPPLLEGIRNTIILKDIVQRNAIRDVQLLESLVRFLCSSIGSMVSSKSIADYLTSSGRQTTHDTIDSYLGMLESAYVFHRARRYDLKGKLHLKTQGKFYITDPGIRNNMVGFRDQDYGHVLENIVYLELIRRGYEVSIGRIGGREVDFVAVKPDNIAYYQVTMSMMNEEVQRRELAPLLAITDNYDKIILSMDRTPVSDYKGIRNVHIWDFLLAE